MGLLLLFNFQLIQSMEYCAKPSSHVESHEQESEHYSDDQYQGQSAIFGGGGPQYQEEYQQPGNDEQNLRADYEQLRVAFTQLHHYLQSHKESLRELQSENCSLKQQLLSKEARQHSPSSLDAKYVKALNEISALLTTNKQLKEQLDSKSQSPSPEEDAHAQFALYEERIQDEQAKRGELERLNAVYEQKLHELKESLKRQEQLYEQKISEMQRHLQRQADELDSRQADSQQVRILAEQVAQLTSENANLLLSNQSLVLQKQCLQNTIISLQEQRNGPSSKASESSLQLKQYIDRLKSETSKLQEVLSSKDQLQTQKNSLNREAISLNKQISQLTTENTQLESRLATASNKQYSLHEQIRKLQSQVVEQQKINTALLTKDRASSDQRLVSQLKAEIEQLKGQAVGAPMVESVTKTEEENVRTERMIPVQIRIRELKVMLEMLMGTTGGSSVTMETSNLLDIRTFTVEFEERLKLMSNENDHLKKKIRDYKERFHALQKQADLLQKTNTQLGAKIDGYEHLVERLQQQLSKSIKKSQQTTGQFTLQSLSRGQLEADLRLQISDLEEKLELQHKYFEQQLQTKILEYEAKVVTMQKQVDGAHQEMESISLYTAKIQELSDRLVNLDILNNQLKAHVSQLQQARPSQSVSAVPDQGHLIKQVYERLTEREAQILKLEYSLKDKQAELHEHQDAQNEMKQQIHEQQAEIQKLKEDLEAAESSQSRVAYEAKRISQEQTQKQVELAKLNESLRSDLKKYKHFEEQLGSAQQSLHLLKVSNAQLSEKCSEQESELSRLRHLEQSLRELSLKHNQLQNQHEYARSVGEAEKSRFERYLKDKDNEIVELNRLISKLKEESAQEAHQLRSQLGEASLHSETIRRKSEISQFKTTEITDENGRLRAENNGLLQEIERYRQNEARGYEAERKAAESGMLVESMKYKLDFALKEAQRMKNRMQELEETCNMEVAERQRMVRTSQNTIYETNIKLEEETFKNGSLKSEVDRLQKALSDMLRDSLTNSRKLVAQAGSGSPYRVLSYQPIGQVVSFQATPNGTYKY